MKEDAIKKYLILLIALLFILCFSCNKQKEEILPFSIDDLVDKEPNDIFKNPIEVTSQSPIIGFFNKKKNIGDKDYYRVYFPLKGTSYKIVQTAVPGIDSKLSFFTSYGKRLFYVDDAGRGESEKLWDFDPIYDNIILLVESKIRSNEKVPYLIDFIPKNDQGIDETEPNGNIENAVEIKIDELKKGLISPRSDIDYYKIKISNDKIYNFSISIETLSNIDINFILINKKYNKNKYINYTSWGGKELFPFLSNEKGEYYIKVSGNIKSHDRKDPIYYVSIDTNLENETNSDFYFEREYNDSSDLATELIDGAEISGVFYPKNDPDWFKFDLFKDSISVDISLSNIRGLDPIIELYNKDLNKILTVNENKTDYGETLKQDFLQKGRYYVRIISKGYSLTVYKLFFNIRYK